MVCCLLPSPLVEAFGLLLFDWVAAKEILRWLGDIVGRWEVERDGDCHFKLEERDECLRGDALRTHSSKVTPKIKRKHLE